MAQDGPQLDPCSPKVFPMYHQDAINLPQDVHPTTHNIQHTSHSPGPAECAVAIESAAPRMGVQGVLDLHMESLKLLKLNMFINKMQKIDEQSLNHPSLNPSPGPCAFRRAGPKSAPAIFEISLFYQQKCWSVVPAADPNFNAQAFSLHRGWPRAKSAFQQGV